MSAPGRWHLRLTPTDGSPVQGARTKPHAFGLVGGVVAVAIAVWMAAHRAWICDDAFISFRYAENFVRGLGLVFNRGERVEGYTNFLWTVWISLGLKLGADAEGWSAAWGIVAYGVAIGLLAHHARRRTRLSGAALVLPLAALLGALHLDWQRYATSGLETSLFTMLLVLAYVLLLARTSPITSSATVGVVLALAAMTRPEGALFAVLGGVFVLWTRPRRWRALAAFALGYLALWGPFTLWRITYYGDVFPNTFYAKSGGEAWWGQGWTYVRLYFQKYWVMAAALPAAGVSLWLARSKGPRQAPSGASRLATETLLATAFSLGLLAYVMRVGGDFMFARMLVPVTPFLLVLLELALVPLLSRRPAMGLLASGVVLATVWWSPEPIKDAGEVSGIVNEQVHYPKPVTDDLRWRALSLRPFLAGLPVCVAFLGSEARLVYYARPPVAIECETGLTDRWVAHQPLARRGRVGHEKHAPPDYLIGRRRAHVTFHSHAPDLLGLREYIPQVTADFGGFGAFILHWDGPLMAELRRRGVKFADFPSELDETIAELPRLTDTEVRDAYAKIRHFYFDFVPDSARERPFLSRLRGS